MPDTNVPQPAKKPTAKAKLTTLPQTLESARFDMNAEFCFIERLPGIAVIPTPDDPELHIYSRGEFIQSVCSDRIINGLNIAGDWMKWPKRNKVRNLTYAPGEPQIFKNQLNTWVRSKIIPSKGDLTLWFAYLDHIFASDSTYRDWFIAWLAYQFQHPGVKLHSATVFWSPETGTGKSFFGYLVAELFGPHNFSEINESELHGRFNFWAARKQFVMGEEIKGSNAQKHNDFIKSVITRKFVTIDTKNTPHYTLPDCINYFFTSNRDNAFSLEDTDRRFFVHQLADKKLDADYVSRTLKPWLDAGGYSAILNYLMHEVDLMAPLAYSKKPFNPFGAAPQTAARKAMIDAGREEEDLWLEELASSDANGPLYDTPGWRIATADDLYAQFLATHPKSRVSSKCFVGKMKKVMSVLRGNNVVKVREDAAPKRLYCSPGGFRDYERADLLTLITLYEVGRDFGG